MATAKEVHGPAKSSVWVTVEGPVVTAVIDRTEVRNAIDYSVIDGLSDAIDIAQACGARVLVIRGAGETFCAGADLALVERLRAESAQLDSFVTRLGNVLERIETAPFASVAIVEGYAVAGGFELILACDVVVASNTAQIGDRHAEYGLVPATGGSVRLHRRLPEARANYLLLSGSLLSGEQAADWGLVTFAVSPEKLDSLADRVIGRLASRSSVGLATTKRMLVNAQRLSQAEALTLERAVFLSHMASADVAQGLAAFGQRRVAAFDSPQRMGNQ